MSVIRDEVLCGKWWEYNFISLKFFIENNFTAPPNATISQETTTTEQTTTEFVKYSNKKGDNEKKDNNCPGVCVEDRIADYCEAYLKSPNLCESGSKCCVAKDQYMDDPNLRILIGSQNSNANNKSPVKPQKTSSEKVWNFYLWKC